MPRGAALLLLLRLPASTIASSSSSSVPATTMTTTMPAAAFSFGPLVGGVVFFPRVAWRRRRHHISTSSRPSSRRSSSSSSSTNTAAVVRGGEDRRGRSPPQHFPLPPGLDGRRDDVEAAILSVLVACRAARSVQPSGMADDDDNDGSLGSATAMMMEKEDSSPVTIGDYASQALALDALFGRFPNDEYVAEEGSDALRADERLTDAVLAAVNRGASLHDDRHSMMDVDRLLRAVDRGGRGEGSGSLSSSSSSSIEGRRMGTRRVWCLDPIDGTKGFLRGRIAGGQYCVALALLEDGVPVLGVLGCPNLPSSSASSSSSSSSSDLSAVVTAYGRWSEEEIEREMRARRRKSTSTSFFPTSSRGCLFLAVRGLGCYEIPLRDVERHFLGERDDDDDDNVDDNRDIDATKSASGTMSSSWTRLRVTPNDGSTVPASRAKFCLGVERGFSDPNGTVLEIARVVHGPDALIAGDDGALDVANSMRLDGQGKYGLLARGDAECFLRLPRVGYVDWVWDVAAGYVVLTEAGGRMTDVRGRPIDFSDIGAGPGRRAKLPDHVRGIVGSAGGVFHRALLDAYAKVEQTS